MTRIKPQQITAVILAGGQGKRLGGLDKGRLVINETILIEHIISVIRPQVANIMISANRNSDYYTRFGFPVQSDQLTGFQGPLAGIAACMLETTTSHIVSLPCDGPALPSDLVKRLASALDMPDAELAVAHDGARLQPVYALIPVHLRDSLNTFLASGQRMVERWYAEHKMALADFSDKPEIFININTPEDRHRLEVQWATQ